jgi:hypothetical protein
MSHEDNITKDVLAGAGKSLFVAQMVEFSLSNLCSMFPHVALDTRFDAEIFGMAKERTPSVRVLMKALDSVGVDPSDYLFPEIDDFSKRRDWLAHRMFLEFKQSVPETRQYQKKMLEEMADRGRRLIGVLAAVQYHIASSLGVASPIPEDNPVKGFVDRNLEEGRAILEQMLRKKNKNA